MRLTFKLVNLKQITRHMWVGLTQSVEHLNRTKKASLSEQKITYQQTAFGLSLPCWLSSCKYGACQPP